MWIVWEWTQTLKLLKIMKKRPQLLRLRRTRIYIFWKHPNEVNILKKIYGEKDTLESIFWRSCSENHETLVVRQNKTNFQRSRHPRNEEISPRASLHNLVSPQLVYFGPFLKKIWPNWLWAIFKNWNSRVSQLTQRPSFVPHSILTR